MEIAEQKKQPDQNEQVVLKDDIKDGTAGHIGKQYGVGAATIRRDADFAKGLDTAEEVSPGIKDAILKGTVKAPRTKWRITRRHSVSCGSATISTYRPKVKETKVDP